MKKQTLQIERCDCGKFFIPDVPCYSWWAHHSISPHSEMGKKIRTATVMVRRCPVCQSKSDRPVDPMWAESRERVICTSIFIG